MHHIVTVSTYSLEAGFVGKFGATVYTSAHRSAKGASRRLAEIINGKTERAKAVRRALGSNGGRYSIKTGDSDRSLMDFRENYL